MLNRILDGLVECLIMFILLLLSMTGVWIAGA